MKCKNNELVQHHVKYKELHGVDEIVMMTWSEHRKLHNRLRNEQKCNIPSHELAKIARAAHDRTDKRKKYKKTFIKEYALKNIKRISFAQMFAKHIEFCEYISYNRATGSVSYSARFSGTHGYKLVIIDIND